MFNFLKRPKKEPEVENWDGSDDTVQGCLKLKFQCPLKWDNLQDIGKQGHLHYRSSLDEKFCGSCGHNVYYLRDIEDLKVYKKEGKKCVMANSQTNGIDLNNWNNQNFEIMGGMG